MKTKRKRELLSCCNSNKKNKEKGPLMGIIYGLIPHIGCIAFIIGSIFGATILVQFFRPLLMNQYIFYYLILISIAFATLSALLYLKNNKLLSWQGIGSKKRYLGILYGSTIGINIILFFLVFPLIANVGKVSAEGLTSYNEFSISVNIPCPGHAYLITNELKTLNGVIESQYSFPNKFKVYYNSSRISVEEILDMEVFKQYPAKITTDENGSK